MVKILVGDAREKLRELESASVHCVVTSPPYWGLRDYSGGDAEIGLEDSLDGHIQALVDVFREVWRVLRDDGTLWLNYGDAYAANTRCSGGASKKQDENKGSRLSGSLKLNHGLKPKDLMFLPTRIAMALQADGWYVRSEIVWHKPNPMPESVKDRPSSAHEKFFLLTKSRKYFYDYEAVQIKAKRDYRGTEGSDRIPGKNNGLQAFCDHGAVEYNNLKNVWTIAKTGYSSAHFATFPPKLIEPCIKAGCPQGGMVLDPFGGAGTTGLVADRLARDAILIELNPEYAQMAEDRIKNDNPLFAEVSRAKSC